MAGQFARDLDTLMNPVGRLREKTEQHAQQVPEVGALFRKLSDKKVGVAVLRKLDSELDQPTEKKSKGRS